MIKKILTVILGMCVAGCQIQSDRFWGDRDFSESDVSSTQMPVKTKTAILLPLSGEAAAVGEQFRNAALMAQLERSADNVTEISFYDTQGTPTGALDAYQQAQLKNPDIVLGPIFSTEVQSVSNLDSSIPMLSFTSDTSVLNEHTYSLALLIPQQIKRIVDFSCQKGQMRFAVLGPNDKSGDLIMNSFSQAMETCPGMQITKVSLYEPKSTDLTNAVTKIAPPLIDARRKDLTDEEKELLKNPSAERLDFDALFVFEQGVKLQQLISLLNYYDVSTRLVPFYGLATLRQNYNKELVGAYFPDIPQAKLTLYKQNYQAAFGQEPISLSSLIYDAVSLVAFLSQNGMLNDNALTSVDGYQGVNGRFRLNEDGTNNRLLEIFQIRGKGLFVPVSAAPVGFE